MKAKAAILHLIWDQGVAGSNPVFPTTSKRKLNTDKSLRFFYVHWGAKKGQIFIFK
jgi:hypothetical protein